MSNATTRTTTYGYNVLGEQTQETDPIPAVGQTPASTATTYDALGNVLTSADALGDTTYYAYDSFDRLAGVTDPLGTGPGDANHTTVYTYDDNGNQKTETDPDGNKTTYTYDAMNRQTGMTDCASASRPPMPMTPTGT